MWLSVLWGTIHGTVCEVMFPTPDCHTFQVDKSEKHENDLGRWTVQHVETSATGRYCSKRHVSAENLLIGSRTVLLTRAGCQRGIHRPRGR